MRVRDFAAARAWYERLLGPSDFDAHTTETVWMLGDDHGLAVHEHERAGNGSVTLLSADLDATLAEIAGRGGLRPSREETYSNGVRKAIFLDPDGNELGFGGVP